MGASCWIYYVPYQEHIEQAFQALRQHLFETGDYVKQETYLPPPRTIEEVLLRFGGSGTHTAMDLVRVSTQPRDYGAVPLPAVILHQFLAEIKPTRTVVEALVFQDTFWSQIDRESPSYKYSVSEETRRFVESNPSKQELVEALLAKEEIWMDFHLLIRSRIEAMTNQTRMGDVIPFSSEELVRFFGVEKPTRAEFEPILGEIWDQLNRWSGFYVVLYQDGTPHEIAFVGVSGD
jgi:hypothetical protein